MELLEKTKTLPTGSGVYIFKDADGEVIYVGKAKNLRNRVRSYFGDAADPQPKVLAIRRAAADLDYILTATEVEAFLLESQLIKKHRPRYNVRLKDDKEYPYIKLDLADEFPRLEIVRKCSGTRPVLWPLPQRRGGQRHFETGQQTLSPAHLRRLAG